MIKDKRDPVFKAEDGKWWYWNEIWCDKHGPFDTQEQAEADLANYCRVVLGHG